MLQFGCEDAHKKDFLKSRDLDQVCTMQKEDVSRTHGKKGICGHGHVFSITRKLSREPWAESQDKRKLSLARFWSVVPKTLILGELGLGSSLVTELKGDVFHDRAPYLCFGGSPPPGELFSPLYSSLHCKVPSQHG